MVVPGGRVPVSQGSTGVTRGEEVWEALFDENYNLPFPIQPIPHSVFHTKDAVSLAMHKGWSVVEGSIPISLNQPKDTSFQSPEPFLKFRHFYIFQSKIAFEIN